jgi:hypothetical protein
MSRTFNQNVPRPTTFPHNSYVIMRYEIPRKFDSKWLDPYQVRSEEPLMGTYELEDCYGSGLSVRIHANLLCWSMASCGIRIEELSSTERNYPAQERELLAILHALRT